MTEKIEPLGDRVLVRLFRVEEKTESGLYLPASGEGRRRGVVVAVGPGCVLDNGTRRAIDVEPGDRVLLSIYGTSDLSIDGEEHSLIDEGSILARLSG